MVFLEVVELMVVALLIMYFVDQLVWPLLSGKPVFWRYRRVGRAISDAEEELSEDELVSRLSRLQTELTKRRNRRTRDAARDVANVVNVVKDKPTGE